MSGASSQIAGAPGRRGGGGAGDERQVGVVDGDELGGLGGGLRALGHDEGDALADVAHAPDRQDGMGRHEHGRAVAPVARHEVGKGAEAVGLGVGAGQDGEDARVRQRGGRVDAEDVRVGPRRAEHVGVGLAGEAQVVDERALAPQEARVLQPRDGLADAELPQVRSSAA